MSCMSYSSNASDADVFQSCIMPSICIDTYIGCCYMVIFVNFWLTCVWWCGNHGGNDNVSETTLEPVEGRIRFPAFKYQITKYQIPSNKGCTIMCQNLHCQRALPCITQWVIPMLCPKLLAVLYHALYKAFCTIPHSFPV